MKIKLAILENDAVYLKRIASVFNIKYADKLEVHSFTDANTAIAALRNTKIDVFLANESIDVDTTLLPEHCGFAYLVDNLNIEEIKGEKTVCRFQKAEIIYKQILNVYSEKAMSYSEKGNINSDVRIVLFSSFSGGVGTSSLAAATARFLALKNIKVIYLNLEKTGEPEIFFKGEGQFTFGDVIYAIKGKKANLSIKIESSVKTSIEGVHYFAAPKMALDVMELNVNEISDLINALSGSGDYEYIIVDSNFNFTQLDEMLWGKADDVILVSDGSEVSNLKTERSCNAIEAMQSYETKYELGKAKLIYNKFSSKAGKAITGIGLTECGGIPRYEHASTKQVFEQISTLPILEKLVR